MPQNPGPKERDITSSLADGKHFARKNAQGYTELVDSLSGIVVAILGAPESFGEREPILEQRLTRSGHTILVESSLPANVAENLKNQKFNPYAVDLLCEKIINGKNITEACKEPGMPSYTVLQHWKRMHPEIIKQIEEAKAARAEWKAEEALRIAMDNEDFKFPTQAAKLKVDTLMQTAGFDNSKFSPKSKVDVAIQQPVQVVIVTGVPERDVREEKNRETITVKSAQPNNPIEERLPDVDGSADRKMGPPSSLDELASKVRLKDDLGDF